MEGLSKETKWEHEEDKSLSLLKTEERLVIEEESKYSEYFQPHRDEDADGNLFDYFA